MAIEREVAGMRCSEVLDLLSDYLDGDLAPERRAQLAAHLQGCDACERFGGIFGSALRALRQEAAPPAQEPAGVFDRLGAQLRKATGPGEG